MYTSHGAEVSNSDSNFSPNSIKYKVPTQAWQLELDVFNFKLKLLRLLPTPSHCTACTDAQQTRVCSTTLISAPWLHRPLRVSKCISAG
jgi:hypothetical protein